MATKSKEVPPLSRKKLVKTPKIAEEPWRGHPVWLFCCFDSGLEFPDKRKSHTHTFLELGDRLKDYERRTWLEILGNGGRDHQIFIDNLESFARQRLTFLRMDDENHQEILRLRFDGTNRLWGFKDGDTFKVLWWDPHHEITPSPKKHT